jgi:putative endonuclease
VSRSARYRRGRWAELAAAALLTAKGYRVLAWRWRCSQGELDLVARRGGTLVFVEVKARRTEAEAAEAVTLRQRRRIERAASAYLQRFPECTACACRFDVVRLTPPFRLRHLPDAWRPEW